MFSFPSNVFGELNSLITPGSIYSLLIPKHLLSISIFPEKLSVHHSSNGSLFIEPGLQMLNRTSHIDALLFLMTVHCCSLIIVISFWWTICYSKQHNAMPTGTTVI